MDHNYVTGLSFTVSYQTVLFSESIASVFDAHAQALSIFVSFVAETSSFVSVLTG